MINQDSESIIVLGAKPDPLLPAVATKFVLGANGAVEVALPYREKYGAKIIGLVPAVELRKHLHIQESFKKTQPDEIIVFGNDSDITSFIREDLELLDSDIILINNRERGALMEEVLGWRVLLVMLERIKVRGFAHMSKRVIPDIVYNKEKNWLLHSTGLDAIMYAMKRFPIVEKIITAGIGLQGGEHFNNEGEFMSKTALADRGTMRHWPQSLRKHVYTTDEVMSDIGDVPIWNGPTF